jgi:hypothetical protein
MIKMKRFIEKIKSEKKTMFFFILLFLTINITVFSQNKIIYKYSSKIIFFDYPWLNGEAEINKKNILKNFIKVKLEEEKIDYVEPNSHELIVTAKLKSEHLIKKEYYNNIIKKILVEENNKIIKIIKSNFQKENQILNQIKIEQNDILKERLLNKRIKNKIIENMLAENNRYQEIKLAQFIEGDVIETYRASHVAIIFGSFLICLFLYITYIFVRIELK